MPQHFTNQDGKPIVLADKPFATAGGEGTIYSILEDQHWYERVAKIYHTSKMANSRREKILFMYANNPVAEEPYEIKKSIIWVEDVLYKDGEFVGFVMNKVRNAISLKALTLARNPSKKFGLQWQKFDHNQIGSHQKRLIIAYNLSQAVNVLHKHQMYVLVDLKPENVFVREDASVAIIDLDSIQINTEDKVFAASVFTEEYAPPEKHKGKVALSKGNIEQEWDHFSLAVIIYELLFGIHPFQASHIFHTTRPELIKGGFFVHGSKQDLLLKIPTIHQNFNKLSPEVQSLFFNTFEQGNLQSQIRVKPIQWAETLLPQISDLSVYQTRMDLSALVPSKKKNPKEARTSKFEGTILTSSQTKTKKSKKKPWKKTKRWGKALAIFMLVCFYINKADIFVRIDNDPHYQNFKIGMTDGKIEELKGYPNRINHLEGEMDKMIFQYKDSNLYFTKESRMVKGKEHIDFFLSGFTITKRNREIRNRKYENYFFLNSKKSKVIEIQGMPDKIELNEDSEVYIYGESKVTFNQEKKIDWYHQNGELKLILAEDY